MKIVVIDDERAMHLIMRRMLGKIEEVHVVGCFVETMTAFSYLENHEVDLLLVDISMPRESGLDFAQRLRERGGRMKIVFVTSHQDYALSAFDVHAYDYIVKPVTQERLHRTIQRALSEQSVEASREDRRMAPPTAGMMETKLELKGDDLKAVQESRINPLVNGPDDSSKPLDPHDVTGTRDSSQLLLDPLTNREVEILLALTEGLSNREIADRFRLTEGTVKNHLYNLYSKLSVKRRSQAIKRARELQILG
ncbi:two component transcriptional regulator, LytTR family [Paenibacillus sp. 1_12]|uniref:response regulator transcription factor n=1 Tax=Paenibacillus sp. 1_12 TaxID=1566278 RepID=UPI0008EF1A3E|nr:response regulator transcription factor [Paenibacillus sp. 1_12]SFL98793.1 two component transcriptional regulator, LytTR family [Paenibacillus sp. 1_12]